MHRPIGISNTTGWLRGGFEGRIELTQVGSRRIFRERWNRKFRYRGTTPGGAYAIALPLDQPDSLNWVGSHDCSNTIIVQAPGKDAELVSSD